MQNKSVELMLSIGWCSLTYFFAIKSNPGYGTAIVLATLFVLANIYYYINWKRSVALSFNSKVLSVITLLIYAFVISELFNSIFPVTFVDLLKNHSISTLKIYLLTKDMFTMLFTMIVLSPVLIFIFNDKFKKIVILLSLIIIIYPLLFSSVNKITVLIGIVLANVLGSLLAIYLTTGMLKAVGPDKLR